MGLQQQLQSIEWVSITNGKPVTLFFNCKKFGKVSSSDFCNTCPLAKSCDQYITIVAILINFQ